MGSLRHLSLKLLASPLRALFTCVCVRACVCVRLCSEDSGTIVVYIMLAWTHAEDHYQTTCKPTAASHANIHIRIDKHQYISFHICTQKDSDLKKCSYSMHVKTELFINDSPCSKQIDQTGLVLFLSLSLFSLCYMPAYQWGAYILISHMLRGVEYSFRTLWMI